MSNVMRVQSLNPASMRAHIEIYVALRIKRSSLKRADCEMPATVVWDRQILDANLIVSYFNFANRIADGFGVRASEEEVAGYKY